MGYLAPHGKGVDLGSDHQPRHAIAKCSQTISLMLANTNEQLHGVARAIPLCYVMMMVMMMITQ